MRYPISHNVTAAGVCAVVIATMLLIAPMPVPSQAKVLRAVTGTFASGDVRDHRGQKTVGAIRPTGRCVLYNGHWTGRGCRNGVLVRDHRGEPPSGSGSSLCAHGPTPGCPPLRQK